MEMAYQAWRGSVDFCRGICQRSEGGQPTETSGQGPQQRNGRAAAALVGGEGQRLGHLVAQRGQQGGRCKIGLVAGAALRAAHPLAKLKEYLFELDVRGAVGLAHKHGLVAKAQAAAHGGVVVRGVVVVKVRAVCRA